ncbi:basic salivary proline-rich protein 3-like [Dama dama]|uniref:basic salivary proline-rich protein 3-like n=1 Tax=Dama dama TaxID=30532 RepID=UPI002A359734|nr:basic salivary proline-rich protein 3-like [Dama dama]
MQEQSFGPKELVAGCPQSRPSRRGLPPPHRQLPQPGRELGEGEEETLGEGGWGQGPPRCDPAPHLSVPLCECDLGARSRPPGARPGEPRAASREKATRGLGGAQGGREVWAHQQEFQELRGGCGTLGQAAWPFGHSEALLWPEGVRGSPRRPRPRLLAQQQASERGARRPLPRPPRPRPRRPRDPGPQDGPQVRPHPRGRSDIPGRPRRAWPVLSLRRRGGSQAPGGARGPPIADGPGPSGA